MVPDKQQDSLVVPLVWLSLLAVLLALLPLRRTLRRCTRHVQ